MEKAKPARGPSRKAEIRQRILFGASAALLFVGVIAFMQSRTDNGPAPIADPTPGNVVPESEIREGPNLTLDREVRRVAGRFLLTALARENPAESWRLAAPELRNSVTRKQWFAGDMPFAPFPMRSLETTGFQVIGKGPNEVLLQVFLVPKPNTQYEPIRYDMTLVKRSGRWLVSFLLPYAPPPIREEGE